MFRRLVATPNDFTLTIIRLVLGAVFFAHGAQVALGWWGGFGFKATMDAFTQKMGIPAPLAFLAIAAEFGGGIALVIGLLGRIAALGIITVMVVAIATVHWHVGFFMNWYGQIPKEVGFEGFEYHLLAIALALAIFFRGSGALSVDRLMMRSPPPQA